MGGIRVQRGVRMVASFSALRGIRLALGLIVRWSSHYFRVTRFRLLLVYGDLSSNFFLAFLSSERYVNEIEPIKVIGSGMQSYINSKCSLHNVSTQQVYSVLTNMNDSTWHTHGPPSGYPWRAGGVANGLYNCLS